jgi:hypothetical protein
MISIKIQKSNEETHKWRKDRKNEMKTRGRKDRKAERK